MITKIKLEKFKCFDNMSFSLKPLTMFTGPNSTGKSSVLQSLSLLNQTILDNEDGAKLVLNGKNINIGTAGDLINNIVGKNQIRIGIKTKDFSINWEFSSDRTSHFMNISKCDCHPSEGGDVENYKNLVPNISYEKASDLINTIRTLTYISAERLGPREFYTLLNTESIITVGSKGENAVGIIYANSQNKVEESLIINTAPPTLERQTEAWLTHFFGEVNFEISPVKNTNYLTMSIRNSNETNYHRPQNVGYGLTHLLPIIVACLNAKSGQLLLIENPEAHLHPFAQSSFGKFLSKVAVSGVQIILETHSDHILNGIRKSVASQEEKISHQDVAIYFIQRIQEGRDQVIRTNLDNNGTIDNWPDGFFDQYDKDINSILGL